MTTNAFERTKEEIADKVRKLLTKEEAQIYSEKAQHPHARRKTTLVSTIARANDCRTVWSRRWDRETGKEYVYVDVVGYAADVDWTATLYASLEIQLASALRRDRATKPAHENGRTWAVNYIDGFAGAIAARLHKARQEAIDEEQERRDVERRELVEAALEHEAPPAGPSVALVLADKQERVDQEFKVRHPHVRTAYLRSGYSGSARGAGAAAGRNASISRGSISGRRRGLNQ